MARQTPCHSNMKKKPSETNAKTTRHLVDSSWPQYQTTKPYLPESSHTKSESTNHAPAIKMVICIFMWKIINKFHQITIYYSPVLPLVCWVAIAEDQANPGQVQNMSKPGPSLMGTKGVSPLKTPMAFSKFQGSSHEIRGVKVIFASASPIRLCAITHVQHQNAPTPRRVFTSPKHKLNRMDSGISLCNVQVESNHAMLQVEN